LFIVRTCPPLKPPPMPAKPPAPPTPPVPAKPSPEPTFPPVTRTVLLSGLLTGYLAKAAQQLRSLLRCLASAWSWWQDISSHRPDPGRATKTNRAHGRTEPSLDAAQALPHALTGLLLPSAATAAETLAKAHAPLLLLLLRLLRLLRLLCLLLLEARHPASGHAAAQDPSEAPARLPGTQAAPGTPDSGADDPPGPQETVSRSLQLGCACMQGSAAHQDFAEQACRSLNITSCGSTSPGSTRGTM